MEERYIVIFDGVCNFCNGSINFIINRDPEAKFAFTPMQSETAEVLVKKYGVFNVGKDTLMLIKNGECFMWSSAALEIAKDLSGPWSLFYAFIIIPVPLRDFFYKVFARYRYKLFGKRTECMIPSEEVRSRFIELSS